MRTRKTPKGNAMAPPQKEFWRRTIRVLKKAALTPYLQVDLLHCPMLLRQMVLWAPQFLPDLSQVVQFLLVQCWQCALYLHK